MKTQRIGLFAALAAVAVLSACGGSDNPQLYNLESGQTTPDEFSIVPGKPIEVPRDLTALPAPTPGGKNRTDRDPDVEIAIALGGSEAAVRRGGADGGIVTYASRFGVSPSIRQELAAEDLAFRQRNSGRFFERLFNVPVYYQAYEDFELNQHAELERFRRAGIKTVAAPPSADEWD